MIYIGKTRVRGSSAADHVAVYMGHYKQGDVGVLLRSDGEPLCKISVWLPHAGLVAGEFVLDHDVPDDLASDLLDPPGSDLEKLAGPLFEDTGRRVSYGFVKDRPVFRIVDFAENIKEWGVE